MNELIALMRTMGLIVATPKGITIFNPHDVDVSALEELAHPLGLAVRHTQPEVGDKYYDKASNTMKDSEHMLQVGKPTELSDDDAVAHLTKL